MDPITIYNQLCNQQQVTNDKQSTVTQKNYADFLKPNFKIPKCPKLEFFLKKYTNSNIIYILALN